MRGTLLIYDPDPVRLRELGRGLSELGHEVRLAGNEAELERELDNGPLDLALLDAGQGDALPLLRMVRKRQPWAEVIAGADGADVEDVVAAMKEGAFHFLSYRSSFQKIEMLVRKAMEKRMLAIEVEELRDHLRHHRGPAIIGESPAVQDLKKTIRRVATLDCTVLLRGETGTGKELVAKAIHDMSTRADRTFLAVNCGALSADLLGNELFGHEAGAFTGATARSKGLFEAAAGGTILLDEIGDTPPAMQTHLLRVLQEKVILRVGGTTPIPVDVRVLAATNRCLQTDAEAGRFRPDLFYRLNVFTLRIPPLRDRRDDIPLLCRRFLDLYSQQYGKVVERVSEAVMSIFMRYAFPGNVRELINVLERAVVLADGNEVLPEHLPRRVRDAAPSVPLSPVVPDAATCAEPPDSSGKAAAPSALPTLEELEREHIARVLAHTQGNKAQAARILGIDRSSLWRKLKSL